MRQRRLRPEEAQTLILRRDAGEKCRVEALIIGPDRPETYAIAAAIDDPLLPFARVRPDGHRHARHSALVLDANACVECNDALVIREQRIDVDLPDLGMASGKVAQTHERQCDCIEVSGRSISITLQQTPHPRLTHQVARKIEIQRWKGVRGIFHGLDGDAAGPKHQQRPKGRVLAYTEYELV